MGGRDGTERRGSGNTSSSPSSPNQLRPCDREASCPPHHTSLNYLLSPWDTEASCPPHHTSFHHHLQPRNIEASCPPHHTSLHHHLQPRNIEASCPPHHTSLHHHLWPWDSKLHVHLIGSHLPILPEPNPAPGHRCSLSLISSSPNISQHLQIHLNAIVSLLKEKFFYTVFLLLHIFQNNLILYPFQTGFFSTNS